MRKALAIFLPLLLYGCDEKPVIKTTCTLTSPAKRQFVLNVEVRNDTAGRAEGLMYRKTMAEDDAMLFVWPDLAQRAMWMKNTLIPLDMLFLHDHRVVGMVENAIPGDEAILTVEAPANRVLEVKSGNLLHWGVNYEWRLNCANDPIVSER